MRKIFTLMFIAIFMIGLVSAWDADNTKEFDETTQTVTIKETFLGIWDEYTIAKVQLLTPMHNKVGLGYQEVFRFNRTLYINYSDDMKDIEYYDLGNDWVELSKQVDLKYLEIITEEVPVYDYDCDETGNAPICSKTLINTYTREREVWHDYNMDNAQEGGLIIAGFTNVEQGDYVEFIPNWFGEHLEEFASWEAGLNVGLQSYYALNATSGDVIDALGLNNGTNNGAIRGVAGKINNSFEFIRADADNVVLYDVYDNTGVSVSFWLWWNGTNNGERVISGGADVLDLQAYTAGQIYSGASTCDNTVTQAGHLPINAWVHLVFTCNGTTGRWYVNGTLDAEKTGAYADIDTGTVNLGRRNDASNYMNGKLDEVAFYNRTLTQAEVDLLWNNGTGISYDDITPADSPPSVILESPIDYYNSSIDTFTLNYSCSDDYNITNVSLYVDGNLNTTTQWGTSNTTGNISTELTFSDGSHTWNVTCWDNATQQGNGTQRTFTVDTTLPNVNILYPTNTTYYTNSTPLNVSLNFSASDSVALDTCWYYNGTGNTTITCGNNDSINLNGGDNQIIFYANDSSNNVNSSSVDFFINYYTYDAEFASTGVSGELAHFYLNITANKLDNASATMTYNNTLYNLSGTSNGTFARLNTTISLPLILNDTNISFNFEVDVNNKEYFNTTTYGQLIYAFPSLLVQSTACSDQAINFTLVDETNLSELTGEFEYNFRYGLSNNTFSHIYGKINNSKYMYICINQSVSPTWYIGEGEIFYTVDDYVERRYYIYHNTSLTNNTNEIKLFNLLESQQTSFQLVVEDSSLNPYVGNYTSLIRWYSDLDQYNVVDMGETDETGSTVIHVVTEDVDYRIGAYNKDGTLIKLAEPIRMVCLSSPCTYTLKIKPSEEDFTSFLNVEYDLNYNDTSGIWTFEFSDSTQRTSMMNLTIYRVTGTTIYPVCSNTVSAASGAITCNTSAYTGTLKALVERSASPPVPIAQLIIRTATTAFRSTFGLWISMLIAIPIISIFAIVSPIAAVVGGVVAMIPAYYFGSINWIILGGIAILAGIIIHFLKRIG